VGSFKRRAVVGVLAGILVCTLGGVVWAQRARQGCDGHPGEEGGLPGGWGAVEMKKDLGLTEEQDRQVEGVKLEFLKGQVKRQADIKVARLEMMELAKKVPADFAALREKVKQVGAIELDSKLAGIDALEKAYRTLTPEQQKKVPELMRARWEGRREQMHERRGNRGEMQKGQPPAGGRP
jgi:Spy/CpxP family protein refolding chaperone